MAKNNNLFSELCLGPHRLITDDLHDRTLIINAIANRMKELEAEYHQLGRVLGITTIIVNIDKLQEIVTGITTSTFSEYSLAKVAARDFLEKYRFLRANSNFNANNINIDDMREYLKVHYGLYGHCPVGHQCDNYGDNEKTTKKGFRSYKSKHFRVLFILFCSVQSSIVPNDAWSGRSSSFLADPRV